MEALSPIVAYTSRIADGVSTKLPFDGGHVHSVQRNRRLLGGYHSVTVVLDPV